jgi:hypothetical protein
MLSNKRDAWKRRTKDQRKPHQGIVSIKNVQLGSRYEKQRNVQVETDVKTFDEWHSHKAVKRDDEWSVETANGIRQYQQEAYPFPKMFSREWNVCISYLVIYLILRRWYHDVNLLQDRYPIQVSLNAATLNKKQIYKQIEDLRSWRKHMRHFDKTFQSSFYFKNNVTYICIDIRDSIW